MLAWATRMISARNADDLEIINAATIQATQPRNVSEDKLKAMMDAESGCPLLMRLRWGLRRRWLKQLRPTKQRRAYDYASRWQMRSWSAVSTRQLTGRQRMVLTEGADGTEEPEPETNRARTRAPEPQSKGCLIHGGFAARLEGDEGIEESGPFEATEGRWTAKSRRP